MTVFENYAQYYDKFYDDKDYSSETQYLVELIHDHMESASSILDVGCGTGLHALEFAKRGFRVHGVDRSPRMISCAEEMRDSLSAELKSRLTFAVGDLTSLRTGEKYDVVTSIFHVMSYQTSATALKSAVESARRHCNSDGLFIFDFWYGPAVKEHGVELRLKVVESPDEKVVRIATPHHDPSSQLVDVDYYLIILHRQTRIFEEIREVHQMKYFFLPELVELLETCGFSVLDSYEWMTNHAPDTNSWSSCIVAKPH